jgi:hypothetical protein
MQGERIKKVFHIYVCVFDHSAVLDSVVASLKKTHRQADYVYLRVIKGDEILCQWTEGHKDFLNSRELRLHDTDVKILLVLWETPRQARFL